MDGTHSSHARQRSVSVSNYLAPHHNLSSASRAGSADEGKLLSESDQSTDVEMSSIHSSDDDLTDDEETGLTETERKKRRRQRRRNVGLGGGGGGSSGSEALLEEEKGIARTAMIRRLTINGILIVLWYSFSISISVYNKWMFSKENLDFHFPLFTTCLHMLVQFSLASTVLFCFPRFRPGRDDASSSSHSYSRIDAHPTDPPKPPPPLMTKSLYLTRISPCGAATALDIGLGNFSLRFISLTFFTMCKSSVLAFVLLFAFIFRLETPTLKLCAVILLMTIGVILMVSGEAAFNALGFVLVMTASLCSGFRWSLTQILLLRNRATSNPFSSIFFLTPIMFLALLILALTIEGPTAVTAGIHVLVADKGRLLGTLLLLFPGCLAFLMVAAEFALLQRSSVVTLSVCGIFKEVLTISAASVVFGDELSPINVSGLVVTIASIAAYNWLKYSKMSRDAKREAHDIVHATHAGGGGGDADDDAVPGRAARSRGGQAALAEPDDFVLARDSTDAILREPLHLTTHVDRGGGRVESAMKSPTKRPEDLE